jgi:hypothetical protein
MFGALIGASQWLDDSQAPPVSLRANVPPQGVVLHKIKESIKKPYESVCSTRSNALFRGAHSLCVLAIPMSQAAFALGPPVAAQYRVGMTQIDYEDTNPTPRTLALTLPYPASVANGRAKARMPFFTNLHLYENAPIVPDGVKRALILFSHGHGSNG